MVDEDIPPSLPPGVTGDALLAMPAWQLDGADAGEEAAAPPPEPAPTTIEPRRSADPPEESPPPLERILEALLFVGGPALTAARAAEAIRGLSADDFRTAIDGLARAYRTQGRPYLIQPHGDGYVLSLRERFAAVRERIQGSVREARLSQAAVDALALVAYRQPATRHEIDSLRGSDSTALLRLLVRHALIAVQQSAADHETRYITTQRFLDLFGLRSLEDLPQTQDLQRI